MSRRTVLRAGVGLVALAIAGGCADPDAELERLSFLNWQDYVDPTLLAEYTTRTGIQVTYETYESNDELARRLELADRVRRGGRAGASTFDLIVPSDNYVARFRRSGLLRELDHDLLPGLDHLDPVMRQVAVDPGNRFSVPWATGTTGLGYDRTVFPDPPGYEVFNDAAFAGRMTILNERRDALGLALLATGADPNTTDAGAVASARDWLVAARPQLRGFDSGDYLAGLADGSIVVAQAYSSDVLIAREQNPDLAFVIPPAGGLRWIDSLCVPEDARSPRNAHSLIDYFLEPAVAAAQTVFIGADTGNAAARELLPAEVAADPTIFPPAEAIASAVFLADLGDDEGLYDDAWNTVTG